MALIFIMKLYDKIMFYITVPKCVGCGEKLNIEDRALCQECSDEYKDNLYLNCSICAKPLNYCICTNDYLDAHYVHKVVKVYRYHTDRRISSNNLIYSLKRDNRKDVVDFLSDELSQAIKSGIKNPESYLFTSVPRRRSEIVKYGMDHAEVLAKKVAKQLGAKYEKMLISKAKNAQKKSANISERFKNAKFELKNKNADIKGQNIIIIDDIITTGASMGMAAVLLKAAGAGRIVAAAVSIAYKDPFVKLDTNDRFFSKK